MIRLTDEQWERIRKHFPEEHIPDGRAGRKPIPTRHVLEAVLWILNTDAQWHMLPQSAAGVLASPLAKMLADATGAQRDRAGRIKVEPDCSLAGHSEVFVVGDMMNYNDLPGVAEVALQSGLHAARIIKNRVRSGAEPTPWKYWDLGSMAAVDRRSAVLSVHGVRLSG